ncbi:MAG: hypothetical protein ACRCTE_09350 [Cellulosilyticaceae bacterium]
MIRPIDTQILYPQSPELSNRQQVAKQQSEIQQQQFADIMNKENESQRDTVIKTSKDENVKNNTEPKKNQSEQKQKNKKRSRDQKEKHLEATNFSGSTIDIKI